MSCVCAFDRTLVSVAHVYVGPDVPSLSYTMQKAVAIKPPLDFDSEVLSEGGAATRRAGLAWRVTHA